MPQDILTERQRRLLDAVLILGVVALAFVVIGFAGSVFYAFGDILLLFFLAWLLSFALLPLINVRRPRPAARPAGAVIIVYLTIVVLLLGIVVQASATIYASINQFLKTAPEFEASSTILLTDIQSAAGGARPRRSTSSARRRRSSPTSRSGPGSSSGRCSRSRSRASACSATSCCS